MLSYDSAYLVSKEVMFAKYLQSMTIPSVRRGKCNNL